MASLPPAQRLTNAIVTKLKAQYPQTHGQIQTIPDPELDSFRRSPTPQPQDFETQAQHISAVTSHIYRRHNRLKEAQQPPPESKSLAELVHERMTFPSQQPDPTQIQWVPIPHGERPKTPENISDRLKNVFRSVRDGNLTNLSVPEGVASDEARYRANVNGQLTLRQTGFRIKRSNSNKLRIFKPNP